MMHLTLKQLRYFEALARHGHFGHAADALAVSQPALSMQIKELERSLDMELFERGARRVRLTNFGEAFALHVDGILRSVEELGDLARAAREQLLGELRIGIIPTIAPYLLPTIVGNLTRAYDRLDVHVRESLTSTLVQELVEGRIDAAIVALPVSEPSVVELALFSEEFVLVRSGEDAGKPVPDLEQLRKARLLLLEEGHCFREQALSFCKLPATQPREVLDGSSLSTLVQMVSAGLGVTLIPEMAVAVETRSASVSISRFQDPRPSRTVGMVWRRTNPLAKQLIRVAEVVRQSGDTVAKSGTPIVSLPSSPAATQGRIARLSAQEEA